MKPELYTLNGKAILESINLGLLKNSTPTLIFSQDIISSYEEREDSPLYYQLRQVLKGEIKTFKNNSFSKIYFFIDFKEAFPLKDRKAFDALFNFGVSIDFGDNEVKRFVPFLSSQSQSKKCIFAFIREDLFKALQTRLDLDLPFEKNIECKSFAFLPKLYAYRALYLSSSTKVFHALSEKGEEFFTPENIIVLPEKKNNPKTEVRVFTAKAQDKLSYKGEAVLSKEETETVVSTTCFDGEGIITPEGSKLINDCLKKNMQGLSFQVRMPFLKGMLHTVDFKRFLRKNGIEGERAIVKDIFGVERDLFKASVIIRPSVFKLKSLLDATFKDDDERTAFCGKDVMKYYFDKLRLYNHGLYVVKTESSFKNTQYVRLSSQQLSTFDLKAEDIDGIINEHIKMADAFSPENIERLYTENDKLQIEDKPDWMELLLKEPRFLKDPHIQTTLKNHRVSRYNDIAQGRILVRGENRFLSGDLYAFLVDVFAKIIGKTEEQTKKLEELKANRFKNGGVYLPGGNKDGRKVALVRSPHLSRNEDVCTILRHSKEYDEYLGKLTGVAITGHSSYIPAALGGADFDGDHISIIYDKRIRHACHDSGYREIVSQEGNLPFINIRELNSVGKIKKYNYVSSDAVYNTFSNRIGNISNAAMKIAAVEYDKKIEKCENMPSAALCTILTGNEIDATKKGIRPYIDSVLNFSKRLNEDGKHIVNEVENYIKMKRELEGRGGEIPSVKQDDEYLVLKNSKFSITKFAKNEDFNVVTQLLYRWAKSFLNFKAGTTQTLSKKAYRELDEIFKDKAENCEECETVLEGFINACELYKSICNNREYVYEKTGENTAKAVVRLKGQYDDIYAYSNENPSYKDRFDLLQQEIYGLTKELSKEELTNIINLIFSIEKDKFNPNDFWPYVKKQDSHEIIKRIFSLENSSLLLNFDYEGYRLLRYCLDNALLLKDEQDKVEINEQNKYAVKYCEICNRIAKTKVSIAKFEKDLAKEVRNDLAKVLGVSLEQEDSEILIIRKIYPLKDVKTIKAFWKIFSERQVISALGGEVNA